MRSLLPFLTLLLFAQPTVAQDSEVTHAESHLAAAHGLLEAMNVEATMLETSTLMFAQMQLPPEVKETLVSFMAEVMSWDTMSPLIADIYADAYSEAELLALSEFYATPIGQKLVTAQPEVAARMMAITQKIMADNQGRMMELMQAASTKQ